MTFFNKKEEVFDVQLTSEGRRLLSQGRFKPSYYAFYDDDILYDSGYAGVSEAQNLTQDRILDESQYPKPNARFKEAVEKGQVNYKNNHMNLQNVKQDVYLNESPFITPLGTYNSLTQEAPYFELEILSKNEKGITTGSLQAIANSAEKIPQINITCSFQYFPILNDQEDAVYYTVEPLLFSLKEYNTKFSNFTEDFEIEVYEITGSNLTQPKIFILEDTSPKTPREELQRVEREEQIRLEVSNLIEDNLEVLFDQEPERLFGVELITEEQTKPQVKCTDNDL